MKPRNPRLVSPLGKIINEDQSGLRSFNGATATESYRRQLRTQRNFNRVGVTCELAARARFKNTPPGSRRLFQVLFICEARESFPRLKRLLQLFCSVKFGKCALASQSEPLTGQQGDPDKHGKATPRAAR